MLDEGQHMQAPQEHGVGVAPRHEPPRQPCEHPARGQHTCRAQLKVEAEGLAGLPSYIPAAADSGGDERQEVPVSASNTGRTSTVS